MSKKKLFYSVLLIILIGFVLFLYNGYNGNPASKLISKKVLENYLEETYPEQVFHVNEGFYDFKFSQYRFTVKEIGSVDEEGNVKEYDFYVKGFFRPSVNWDGIYYENLDEQMGKRLSEQAQKEIVPLVSKEVDHIRLFDIHIEVLKGKFEDEVVWSKELPLDKPMEVFVQLDSTKQTKEDFYKSAKKIKEILDKENYDYGSIVFNGSGFDIDGEKIDEDGYLKYSLSVKKAGEVELKKVAEHNKDMW